MSIRNAAWGALAIGSVVLTEASHAAVTVVEYGPPAFDHQTPAVGSPFRSGIDLVALTVTVTDPARQSVHGLAAEDFVVFEDGVPQAISYFAPGRVPIDLAILLDTSSSMGPVLATAQQAAVGLARSLQPGDRLTIMQFADRAEVLHPLNDQIPEAIEAIQRTTARGSTALYNALYIAMKDLAGDRTSAPGLRRRVIAVLSDGRDTASIVQLEDVETLATKSGVALYPIVLLPQAWELIGGSTGSLLWTLKNMARTTGADAFVATGVSALPGIYTAIANELAQQYTLGYISTNTRRDGAFRRVSVRVVGRHNVSARTRTGYLGPK
jgi:VWFA-related protein